MTSLFGLNKEQKYENDGKEKININKNPKKKIEIENHIQDLENTLKINQDYIYNIILILPINQKNKKKLIDTLDKIKLLFNEKKQYRKISVDISSKILINKQIIEEIKRRNNENIIYQNDKISNFRENVNKKGLLVKSFLKKFNELEIFIQRESKLPENIEKYGKWRCFTVIPFMKKNEYLLKALKYYKNNNKNKENSINILKAETNFINKSKNIIININENINNNLIEKNNFNNIQNYYLNILSIKEKEIELIKCWINIIIGNKYNQRKKINENIFEEENDKNNKNNFEFEELLINNNNNNNNKELFFNIDDEEKDLKYFSNTNNFWLDSEPEDI